MFSRLYKRLEPLICKEYSADRLAGSFSVGAYIAFSPFVGLHTVMAILFSWLFRLNMPMTFAGSCLINNPWTMVPVYASGYLFGEWLFRLCGINTLVLNPTWMKWINCSLEQYVGLSNISLCSFLVGGNLLGMSAGVLLYPAMKKIFARVKRERKGVQHKAAAYFTGAYRNAVKKIGDSGVHVTRKHVEHHENNRTQ